MTLLAKMVAGGKEKTCHVPGLARAVAIVALRVVRAVAISRPLHWDLNKVQANRESWQSLSCPYGTD